MSKSILIIGGGISGLTALHYLRNKYRGVADVDVKLLEMNEQTGGSIRTVIHNNIRYEAGPNGFLGNKPATLSLVRELNIENELIAADPQNKSRAICVGNELHHFSSPSSFFSFKPLSLHDKIHALMEWTRPQGTNPDETVHEFVSRRFGSPIAHYIFDPLVSGIYAGDIHSLSMRYALPKLYQMEKEHGSVTAALFSPSDKLPHTNKELWSFKTGMSRLIQALTLAHKDAIQCGVQVMSVIKTDNGYRVTAGGQNYFSDQLVLSVPSYAAADLLMDMDPGLARDLRNIDYAPVVVAGLVYPEQQVKGEAKGFGYLRVTREGNEVLGVLFNSNIFSNRAPAGQRLFQLFLGGTRFSNTVRRSDSEIFDLAKNELRNVLKVEGEPTDQFLLRWGRAIPQYDLAYSRTIESVKQRMARHKGLHLLSNYIDGVSVNDCTTNAKALAERIQA